MKIKYKILLLSLVLFIVSVSIIGYTVKINLDKSTESMIIERLEDQVQLVEAFINQQIDDGISEEVLLNELRSMYYNDDEFPDNLLVSMAGKGFIFIMDNEGNNLVHPVFEGENLIDSSSGFKYINDEKNGIDKYISPKNGQWKVTVFSTNNPFDWTIASTAFKDGIIGDKVTTVMKGIIYYAIPILIIYLFLMTLIVHKQLKPLELIIEKFKIGASGDLSMQCKIESSDEIGKLAEAFNGFMISLRGLVFNVNDVSDNVNQKSVDIENSINHAIKGDQLELKGIIYLKQQFESTLQKIDEQVASTNAMIIEVDHVKDASDSNMTEAMNIQNENKTILQLFEKGISELNRLTDKVQMVVSKVESNTQVINQLKEYSVKITDILEAIESIADETNLLALNASIESARAGEAGKGFAVVASEIRKLSENTNIETSKISDLIKGIQNEIKSVQNTNDALNDEVLDMRAISKLTTQDMFTSKDSLIESNSMIDHMVNLLKEQTQATEVIFKQLTSINTESEYIKEISIENNMHIEDVERLLDKNFDTAKDLEESINTLRIEIKKFKLES